MLAPGGAAPASVEQRFSVLHRADLLGGTSASCLHHFGGSDSVSVAVFVVRLLGPLWAWGRRPTCLLCMGQIFLDCSLLFVFLSLAGLPASARPLQVLRMLRRWRALCVRAWRRCLGRGGLWSWWEAGAAPWPPMMQASVGGLGEQGLLKTALHCLLTGLECDLAAAAAAEDGLPLPRCPQISWRPTPSCRRRGWCHCSTSGWRRRGGCCRQRRPCAASR